ncbi:hypothetical protein [Nocardia sp. NPDC023988]|uniref:hypothetical protein n=1 Tax=unclassified Nocardia TaxID=2637762 RepID=UPI0033E92996
MSFEWYDKDLLALLKSMVPADARRWVKADSAWLISTDVTELRVALQRLGVEVSGDAPPPPADMQPTGDAEHWRRKHDDMAAAARHLQQQVIQLREELAQLTSSAPTAPPPNTDWAHSLFAAVGSDLAQSVYKSLSTALHPDTGGRTDLMQQLNAARPPRR